MSSPIPSRRARRISTALAAAASAMVPLTLHAASATWNSSPATDDWVPGANDNWGGSGVFPGSTTVTAANADTATFLTASVTTIDINQAVNVKNIVFGNGTALPSSYTIGASGANAGNSLYLTGGGTISYASGTISSSPVSVTFNAPIVLAPANQTAATNYGVNSFTSGATVPPASTMTFNGDISVGSTTYGSGTLAGSTLTLGRSATQSVINGNISDGGAINGLSLVNAASINGNWKLTGNNTYTSRTILNGGTMEVTSINSVATNTVTGTTHLTSSNLGAPITVFNGTIDLGINSSGATLKYMGNGETTDRIINIGAAGNNTLDASGAGALVFVSNMNVNANSNNSSKILQLTGTSTANNEFRGGIADGSLGSQVVSLSKTGAGTWIVSGNNSFSGGTTVTGGTLGIGSNTALGSLGSLVIGSATVDARGGTRSLSGSFTMTNNLTVGGSNNLVFSGALNAQIGGTLTVNNGATFTISGNGGGLSNSANARTLTVNGAGAAVLNGTIDNNMAGGTSTGSGITYSGTGSLTLGGANTYSGTTAISNGVVYVNNSTGSGTGFGGVTVSGTGRLSGTGRIAPTLTAGNALFLSGSTAVLSTGGATGTGSLTIDLSNTGGQITLGSGKLQFSLGAAGTSLASVGTSTRLIVTGGAAGELDFASSGGTTVDFQNTGGFGLYKLIDTDLNSATAATDLYDNLVYDQTTGWVTSGLTAANLPTGITGASFYVGTASNGVDAGSIGDIFVSVPEPSTLSLIGAGALGLLKRRRRLK